MRRHLSKKFVIQSFSMSRGLAPSSISGSALSVIASMLCCLFASFDEEAAQRPLLERGDLDLRDCLDLLSLCLGLGDPTDLVRPENATDRIGYLFDQYGCWF